MKKIFNSNKNLNNLNTENMKPLTSEERDALWYKISNKLSVRSEEVLSQSFFSLFNRKAIAIALVFFLFIGGATVTFAADNSKPGDLLFSLDLATEKIRLILASGEQKTILKLQFSEERLEEAKLVLLSFAETEEEDSQDNTNDENNGDTNTEENTQNQEENEDEDLELVIDSESIDNSNLALTLALESLQGVKDFLSEQDNDVASLTMEQMILELEGLARDHISDLDKFKTKIVDNGKVLKIKIDSSSDDLKIKFNYQEKPNGNVKIDFRQENKSDKDDDEEEKNENDENEDSDEDDDEDGDDEDDDDGDGEGSGEGNGEGNGEGENLEV